MIATIVFSLVIIAMIVITIIGIKDKSGEEIAMGATMIGVCAFFLFLSLANGYLGHHGKITKEEVITALKTTPNTATIRMAEQWNEQEKDGNNYWCRFTIKDEDLIDIDQILIDYKGETE